MEDKKEDNYLDIIKNFVDEIKFGTITVFVQDGKVIQIEKNEKYRIRN